MLTSTHERLELLPAAETFDSTGRLLSSAAEISAPTGLFRSPLPLVSIDVDQSVLAKVPDGAWPIIVDPSYPMAETNVTSRYSNSAAGPGTLYGNPQGIIRVGNSAPSGVSQVWRSTVNFPLASADNQYVTGAHLVLHDLAFGTPGLFYVGPTKATGTSWSGIYPGGGWMSSPAQKLADTAAPSQSQYPSGQHFYDVTTHVRSLIDSNNFNARFGFAGAETWSTNTYTYKGFSNATLYVYTDNSAIDPPQLISPANDHMQKSTVLTTTAKNKDSRPAYITQFVYDATGDVVSWVWCGGNSTPVLVAPGASCSIAHSLPSTGRYTWSAASYLAHSAQYSSIPSARGVVIDQTPPVVGSVAAWPIAENGPWNTVTWNWLVWNAADNASTAADPSSAIAGHSTKWSQNPSDSANMVQNPQWCEHGSEPENHYTSVPAMICQPPDTQVAGDGVWYFYVRAVDKAGNWSASHRMGPFRIDATAPTAPGTPTPICSAGDGTDTVRVAWSPSTDASSGVSGYSWVWTQDPTEAPDLSSVEGDASVLTATAPPLANGDWYFRLRALDASEWAGVHNGSAVVTAGPFTFEDGRAMSAPMNDFVARWQPRVEDTAWWAGWNSTPGVPQEIADEGYHALPDQDQAALVDCLVDAIAFDGGVSLEPGERDDASEILQAFIFDKIAVDESLAPYLADVLDDEDLENLPTVLDDPVLASALAQLDGIRDLLPQFVDQLEQALPPDLLDRLADTGPVQPIGDLPSDVGELLANLDLADLVDQQINELDAASSALRDPLATIGAQLSELDVPGWAPAATPTDPDSLVSDLTTEYLSRLGATISNPALDDLLDGASQVTPITGGLLSDALQALDDAGGMDVPSPLYTLCGTNTSEETTCAEVPVAAINPFDSDGDGTVDVLAQLTLGPCDLGQVLDLQDLLEITAGLIRQDNTTPLGLPISFCVRAAPGVDPGTIQSHVFFAYDVPQLDATASLGFDGRAAGLGTSNIAAIGVDRLNSFRDAAGEIDIDINNAPSQLALTVALQELAADEGEVPDSLIGRLNLTDVPASLNATFDVDLDGPGARTAHVEVEASSPTTLSAQFRSVASNGDATASDATLTAVIDELPTTRVSIDADFNGQDASAAVSTDAPATIDRVSVVGVLAPRAPESGTIDVVLDARNFNAQDVSINLDGGATLDYEATGLLGAPAAPFGPVTAAATLRDDDGIALHGYLHASSLPSSASINIDADISQGLPSAVGTFTADFAQGLPDIDALVYARDLAGEEIDLVAAIAATAVPAHLSGVFDVANATAMVDAREPGVSPATSIGTVTLLAGIGDLDLGDALPAGAAHDTLALVARDSAIGVAAHLTDVSTAAVDLDITSANPGVNATLTSGSSASNPPLVALAHVDRDSTVAGDQLGLAYIDQRPQSVAIDASIDLADGDLDVVTSTSAALGVLDALYADTEASFAGSVHATQVPANINVTVGIATRDDAAHALLHGEFRDTAGVPQGVGGLSFTGVLDAGSEDEAAVAGEVEGAPATVDLQLQITEATADRPNIMFAWTADGNTASIAAEARFGTNLLFGTSQRVNGQFAVEDLPTDLTVGLDGTAPRLAMTSSGPGIGPISAQIGTNDTIDTFPGNHLVARYRPDQDDAQFSVRFPGLSSIEAGLLGCDATRVDGLTATCTGDNTHSGFQGAVDFGQPLDQLGIDIDVIADEVVARIVATAVDLPASIGLFVGHEGATLTSSADGPGAVVFDAAFGDDAAIRTIAGIPPTGDLIEPMALAPHRVGVDFADGSANCTTDGCDLGFVASGLLPAIPTLARVDVEQLQLDIKLPPNTPPFDLDARLSLPNLDRYTDAPPAVVEASVADLPADLDLSIRAEADFAGGLADATVRVKARSNLPIGALEVLADVDFTDFTSPVTVQQRPDPSIHEADWLTSPIVYDQDRTNVVANILLDTLPTISDGTGNLIEIASIRLGDDDQTEPDEFGFVETNVPGAVNQVAVTLGLATPAEFASHAAGDSDWREDLLLLVSGSIRDLDAGENRIAFEQSRIDADVTTGTCSSAVDTGFVSLFAGFAGDRVDADVIVLESLFRTSLWTDLVGTGDANRLRPTDDTILSWKNAPQRWRMYAGADEADNPVVESVGGPAPTGDPYGDFARIGIRVLNDELLPSVGDGEFDEILVQTSILISIDAVAGFGCGDFNSPFLDISGAAVDVHIDPLHLRNLTLVGVGVRSMTMLLPHGTTFQVGGNFDQVALLLPPTVGDSGDDRGPVSYRGTFDSPGLEIYFRPFALRPFPLNRVRIPLLAAIEYSAIPGANSAAGVLGSPQSFSLDHDDGNLEILAGSDEAFEVLGFLPCNYSFRPRPIVQLVNGAQMSNPQHLGGGKRHVLTFGPPIPGPSNTTVHLPTGGLQLLSMLFNHTGGDVVDCF